MGALKEVGAVPSTVKDVAKLAGVSTATVSRVTNGAGVVSDHARRKVLEAISRLQYSPNSHAVELARAGRGVSKGTVMPKRVPQTRKSRTR
jgi:LacI family transcriptional regulator